MIEKLRREPGFITVWNDTEDIKKLGARAYLLRHIYRLHADPETQICNISERTIEAMIGWDRKTIRKSKQRLFQHGEAALNGYYGIKIRNFLRFKSGGNNPPLDKKSGGNTPPKVEEILPQSGGNNTPNMGNNSPSTYYKSRKDVVDSKATTLSSILKDDLKHLFETQGQQGDALLVFFYTVAQERLSKGHKEGILRIAIKRAISANSKSNIQDILSNDSLTAIKLEQDRIKQKAKDDHEQAEALKNKAPDHVASDYIKQMKEAVK